jgi:hypothetical protein
MGRQCARAGSSALACGDQSYGGGSLQWSELMVEAACAVASADSGGDIRACG